MYVIYSLILHNTGCKTVHTSCELHLHWFRDKLLYDLLVAIATNCKISIESDKLIINEKDSECHKDVISDSEMNNPAEISVVDL